MKVGGSVVLTCRIEAKSSGNGISWYRELEGTKSELVRDGENYSVSATERDAKSFTSQLKIDQFGLASKVGSYFCGVDYDKPILDEFSRSISLSLLGKLE